MKKYFLLFLLNLAGLLSFAQLKSPSEFLGYPLGSKYSPHFKVVNYFKHVAESVPNMVKLEQYGETNESRPLLLAYIANTDNLPRLETIRQHNLANAGIEKGSTSTDEPAIVWLSYNVHGNETSSSEAAMQTIYELVNPKNNKTKEYLKNTIVIMDPCINPDGRDRYVNWFNSVVGDQPNPQPFTREHREPWPRGRANHYYFDLNRDWAWQSQKESQQRIVKYNQWLPHVHVDFHEQGYNEPYYFAPAAEPFHEVITPWQREFQTTIGKNHAKYFDEQGWLYFTKERFDLLYPSYGDTYPIYKGAIGMTYEQGGIGSGTAVIIEDGDTLTLNDRVAHHFTTGISTVEISSKNAQKLVNEFIRFYDKARNNPGAEYKSYVIKKSDGDNLDRLIKMLDRNAIDWSYTNSASLSGVNYATGKSESFKTDGNDIVINTNQPNSTLLKVLFDKNPKLTDSVTYDITAWSVPYMFGVTTYGVNANVPSIGKSRVLPVGPITTVPTNVYAYAIKWNGLNSAQFLAEVLKKGVRVRFAEQPFTANGLQFEKGALIIPKSGNKNVAAQLDKIVTDAAVLANINIAPLTSGFVEKGFDLGSDKVKVLNAPRIALLGGEQTSSLGFGEIWHFFDQQLKYPVNVVNVEDLNAAVLQRLDVVIMPDGYYRSLNDKNFTEALKNWVNAGGKLIAIENAAAQLSRGDWGFKLKQEDKKDDDKDKKEDYSALKIYEQRERDYVSNITPGSIYKVQIDNTHPLGFGYPNNYYTLKQDDNIYEFIKDGGWNVGILKKDNYVSGFAGVKAKEKLKDGMLFGEKEIGRGRVIILADNPLFRSFWENGKLLFCNAVFMAGE